MKGYLAFLQKEWLEIKRNYKLLLMVIIFLILGIMNPLTAKLMPKIFSMIKTPGIQITITETITADPSWEQFFKNASQMGLILIVIMFAGMFSNEFSKGTLIPVLTKGLKRQSVIFAKFSMASIVWTLCYLLYTGVSWSYTYYFWPDDKYSHMLLSLFSFWLFGLLLIAVTTLAGVLAKNMSFVLLFTGVFVALQFLISSIPSIRKHSPIRLISDNLALMQGRVDSSAFVIPIILSLVGIIVCLGLGCTIFSKKKL